MELTLYDRARPYLSRIAVLVLAPIIVWVGEKLGLAPEEVSELKNYVGLLVSVYLIPSLIHLVTSKFTNPGNTSSAHLAKTHAEERNAME